MAYSKIHHVKKARKANKSLGIKKGQQYWWWKFRYSAKIVSFVNPGVSVIFRLTEYEQTIVELETTKAEIENEPGEETREEMKLELIEKVENFRDEQQEKLNNLPQNFQESSILNERIEEIENLISEIEDIS